MKLKFTLSFIVLAIAGIVTLESCKNDVDIFAPASDVTLIYGLINASDDVHQIKINRVFQGGGSLDELAQDPTVSEYENIEAALVEILDKGFGEYDTTNRWSFVETIITNKDSGIFYYPEQKIYELNQALDSTKMYAIMVDKLNGSPIVESTTELIQVFGEIISRPQGLDFLGLNLCNPEAEPLENISLELYMPVNAKVMDVYLDFSWQDENLNGVKGDTQTISYYVGQETVTKIAESSGETELVKVDLSPASFFEFIAARVPVVTDADNIKQRVVVDDETLNFRFVSGGEELYTYVEVSAPSTSILETKPDYTNIQNGIGLWSTRSFNDRSCKMGVSSVDFLVNDPLMTGRKFCHNTNATDPNYCY